MIRGPPWLTARIKYGESTQEEGGRGETVTIQLEYTRGPTTRRIRKRPTTRTVVGLFALLAC